jgi:hypothetical protein
MVRGPQPLPPGEERDCARRTMGVGLTHLTLAEKKYRCRITAAEERDSGEGTMGVGLPASSP